MKAQIVEHNGMRYIEMNGKRVDPLAFKSFRPTAKNVGEFYNAGVRLFHVYCSGLPSGLKVPYSLFGETWFGDRQYDFTNLDRQIDFFHENAPEAFVFVNVQLDTREWWLQAHPGTVNSFTHLSQIAADEAWRRDTADYLKALIAHTEEKYPDFVCGYFLLGGYTTEWFSERDYEEGSPSKLAAYRKYTGDPNAEIPSKEMLCKPQEQIFLDPEKDREVITHRRFHNYLVSDIVLYFCHEAQQVLQHQKLVGVFFGYILELLNDRLWNAGHMEFDRINRSEDIDILATPSSYQFRGHDEAGAYMLLCETLEKHGKLCFISFDHSTFLLPTLARNPKRICGDKETDVALELLARMRSGNPQDLLKTKEQTIHAMRREFMQRITKRVGYWWFDMLEGWFYDDDLMEEVRRQVKLSGRLGEMDKRSNSEVAVFVSGESLYYVNKCSRINTELICNQREGLSKMGAPYDIYSMNDLESVDTERYRFYFFPDAFALTDSQRAFIDKKLKRNGKSLLFVGAADYCTAGIAGSEKLLEMKLEECTAQEQEIRGLDSVYGYAEAKNPVWCVVDEASGGKTMGRLSVSRKIGLYKKCGNGYTIYYSALGNLSHIVLRELLRQSGVHIYAENGAAVFVSRNLYGVYNTSAETTLLRLPEAGTFEEIFTGAVYHTPDGLLSVSTGDQPAQMFLKLPE